MTLNVRRLLDKRFPTVQHKWTAEDSIRYALSVGLGMDPNDPRQLRYVHEECDGGLRALPPMASVLSYAGHWSRDPDLGLDWKRILHGEQRIELRRPVPTSGQVQATTRITDIVDKGRDKGAILYAQRDVEDVATHDVLARIAMVTFARGDGGKGGFGCGLPPLAEMPGAAADLATQFTTSTQAALLYRLAGDLNPLHADPRVAKEAGFDRPILHGLCLFAVAIWQVLEGIGMDADAVRSMAARFTAPLYPGETIRTEIWRTSSGARFRVSVPARGVTVLDRGTLGV